MPSPRIVNGAAPERRMTTADAAKVGGISHATPYRGREPTQWLLALGPSSNRLIIESVD
jgi:hypothetical protein